MIKDILTLTELTRQGMSDLFALAAELKARYRKGIVDGFLRGRVLGLVFDKHSTRTRVSFEAAMNQLGGSVIYMSSGDMQVARDEPVRDTARVLSGYIDALAIRTYSQELIEEYAQYADIPIINALSDKHHPCQVLSDLLTIIEHKGGWEGLKIVWVGDGNNVANSWINACAVLGFSLVLACPEGYQPDAGVLAAARSGGSGTISVAADPAEAVRGADVLYTDVWASMGQEDERAERLKAFAGFQLDGALVSRAAADVVVMHCLPAHRGEEITDEVLEGDRSIVWDQAENKLHMHKAILKWLIENNMKRRGEKR
ncbi:MAG: ornithine carbamoyltransferase [Thermodesulfobacteriota bacterium]